MIIMILILTIILNNKKTTTLRNMSLQDMADELSPEERLQRAMRAKDAGN